MNLVKLLLSLSAAALIIPPTVGQTVARVSLDSYFGQANGNSANSRVSADGRFVVFTSEATNLVAGDTNGLTDVFLYDRMNHTCERISVSVSGTDANGSSDEPTISGDGRYVAFSSIATNLVLSDANLVNADIFLRDRALGTTSIVSISTQGTQGNSGSHEPALSADGRWLVFTSLSTNLVANDTNARQDVFRRDLVAGTTIVVSVATSGVLGNNDSGHPAVSSDGTVVTFDSTATNLVVGDTNAVADIFVRDILAGTTSSPTADPNVVIGLQFSNRPTLSGNGRLIAFQSAASNLVGGDTNGYMDSFVYDRVQGTFLRVNVTSAGVQSSDDGDDPIISADGSVVAFTSDDGSLDNTATVSGKCVFLHYLVTGVTTCVSTNGHSPLGQSHADSISSDGKVTTFQSFADNIINGDTNGRADIFTFAAGPPCSGYTQYCTGKVNGLGCLPSVCAWSHLSLSGADDFLVTASNEVNNKTGIMLWSYAQASMPWFGGTLCLASHINRTPAQNSGGTPAGNDCTGTYAFPFTQAYMASQGVVAGSTIYCQYWSRDPFTAPPNNVGLTNAIAITVQP